MNHVDHMPSLDIIDDQGQVDVIGVRMTGSSISNALSIKLKSHPGELDSHRFPENTGITVDYGGLQECDRNDGEDGIQHTGGRKCHVTITTTT